MDCQLIKLFIDEWEAEYNSESEKICKASNDV